MRHAEPHTTPPAPAAINATTPKKTSCPPPAIRVHVPFSKQPTAGRTNLNALPPTPAPADRTEQHLDWLHRLGEIGMQLVERAAAEAQQPPSEDTPKQRRPDPALMIVRLSAMVRACIAQHARLAAGEIPAAPRTRRPTSQPGSDPRRHPISAFLHDAIEDSPKPKEVRAEIHKQVEPIIDEYLASDPGMVHAGAGAVIEICQEFDIPYDPARMPAQLRYPPCHEEFLLAEETNATGPPY
jgi:hypothetical protein